MKACKQHLLGRKGMPLGATGFKYGMKVTFNGAPYLIYDWSLDRDYPGGVYFTLLSPSYDHFIVNASRDSITIGAPAVTPATQKQAAMIQAAPSWANETIRQWNILGPDRVKHNGTIYTKMDPPLYDNKENVVHFKYKSTKRGKPETGDVLPYETILFLVQYDEGYDMYNVEIRHYDKKIEVTKSKKLDGLMSDNFSNFKTTSDVLRPG